MILPTKKEADRALLPYIRVLGISHRKISYLGVYVRIYATARPKYVHLYSIEGALYSYDGKNVLQAGMFYLKSSFRPATAMETIAATLGGTG